MARAAEVEAPERMQRLAVAAADLVEPGMTIGLGTGSTASAVIRELGRRAADGLAFTGVPTSRETETLARELGIPLVTLEEVDRLDLGIDGADEIDPALNAIKGLGGALLREKLVALACDRFVLVASDAKRVDRLGSRTPLPVQVVTFGWRQTAERLATLAIAPERRPARGDPTRPWLTETGDSLLVCRTGPIADAPVLAAAIKSLTGVVDHGLFLGLATEALLVDRDGEILQLERRRECSETA
jgi:ribose 5-phosphate isomerase A